MTENPLLSGFDITPFSKIQNEHYEPAFLESIRIAKSEIDEIVTNTDTPTFENTLEAMAYSGMLLDRISSIFFNLNSAETNEEIQKIAQRIAPLLSEFSNDITLNNELFKRVQYVYDHTDTNSLTTEQQTLLNKTFKSFVRNGALLNDEDKSTLREIDHQLSILSLQFGENVLAETNNYQLHITNVADLDGLPEGAIEAAHALAKSQGKEGWIFTLDFPSYLPFVTYVKNRELRKEMTIAAGKKGFQKNEYNNEDVVLKIVSLRHKRALLLGYHSHADFVLEERMAESPEKVLQFLNNLLHKAKPAALKEFDELKKFALNTEGIEELEKWDSAYISEKLKQQKFQLDDEALKPYFQLENVLNGAFEVAKKLFGIHFELNNTIDKYHPDVNTYLVKDEQQNTIAIFYTDFFPRKGKRNGAWMTSFKSQWKKAGQSERPHVSIVCNFTPPTNTRPSLLTFNEVTTLFHEFGHALHGMLADTTYPNLSGTNVYWDFVELPSQIMENWCYEPETLSLFAKHYLSGEIIPIHYIEKIKESANFLEGIATLRQLSFGMLDMAWHHSDPETITDVKSFENKQFETTSLYPDVLDNAMSTSFSHIFAGGYAAGYYSYKWAEVLDADAFAFFQENGIFNPTVAQKFKENILSKGGTEPPMELYKKFRGQEPEPTALLKRAGLL